MTAALATIDHRTGHPFATLVAVATTASGEPLMLLSGLARHTRNLAADARASLLFQRAAPTADPLTAARLTVSGRVSPGTSEAERARYLARHPAAADYAAFADFGLYRLEVEFGHLVAGFGRIAEVGRDALLENLAGATQLVDDEQRLVGALNHEQAGALAAWPQPTPGAGWRIAGIDPAGADMVSGLRAERLVFKRKVMSPAEARSEIAAALAART
jgi:hypothetical protein